MPDAHSKLSSPARQRAPVALVCTIAAALIGCVAGGRHDPASSTAEPAAQQMLEETLAADRQAAYAATSITFGKAHFFKPPSLEPTPEEIALAPIFVLESFAPASPGLAPPAGTAEPAQPATYWSQRTVELSGRFREQITYVWFPGGPPVGGSESPDPALAVRLTLDENRMPAISEVLLENGVAKVFVSERLETLARKAHGPPLPGRRQSIEGSVEEYPNVVVARVLSDGPMAMGPLTYVGLASGGTVTTLLCRCMPSQADEFVETAQYELFPLERLLQAGLITRPQAPFVLAPQEAGSIHDASADPPDRLARFLRLPPTW